MLRALRSFLKENDMMAYLAMMAVRLLELHRVLKPTGSLYLHCDPTASHYLKILLDAVFGPKNFRNEIIWKRQSAHSDARYKFSDVADTILFYANDNDGRGKYRLGDMASPNPRPNMMYEWKGFAWPQKGWRYQRETMRKLDGEGRIWYPKKKDGDLDTSKRPALKRYLAEQAGSIVTNVWDDINPLHSAHAERLGYPTQKPIALLERIISASSNEGDLVLDPFCGCGTTVHAAQKLNRRWIGIDITHLAISLVKRRLIDAFPHAQFEIHGVPKDVGAARELAKADPHQFQLWALSMIEAQPYKGGKKGADGGIDGFLYFKPDGKVTEKAIIEVKSGGNVSPQWVRALGQVVERERAKIGVLVMMEDPTVTMKREAAAAGFYESPLHGKFERIQILTVEDLFDGKKPYMPWIDPSVFKKAKREASEKQSEMDL
jgi:site-specific DNA-methyltransferase (adenine-specific)